MTDEQQAQNDWWQEMAEEPSTALHVRLLKAVVRVMVSHDVDPTEIRRAAADSIRKWAALEGPEQFADRAAVYSRAVDEAFAEVAPSQAMLAADHVLVNRSSLAGQAVRIKREIREMIRPQLGRFPSAEIRRNTVDFLARKAAQPGADPAKSAWYARVVMEAVNTEIRLFEEQEGESN